MESFFKMVDVQSVLFLYMAVGYFCRKRSIFNDEARSKITDFVILITLPCMIFESFHMEFSLDTLKQGGLALIIATGKKLLSAREIIKNSYEHTLNFVYNRLSEEEIRSSDIDFGCVTYNISDMEPFEAMKKDIPEGKLIDYIVASACVPIFPPKQIDGKKFIDGGVYDNMPINLLARTGCKEMIVVRTNPETKQPKRRIERDDLDIIYITPSANLGRAMAFSPERIENLKQLGYADAMRIITEAEAAAAK